MTIYYVTTTSSVLWDQSKPVLLRKMMQSGVRGRVEEKDVPSLQEMMEATFSKAR